MKTRLHRRQVLKSTGASLGALTLGSSVAAGDSPGRFIVDRKSLRTEDDVEVVHDLAPVDLLIVETTESQLKDSRAEYMADVRMARGPYQPVSRDDIANSEEDQELFHYQWDKQDQSIPEAHDVTRGKNTRVAIIDSGIASGHPDLEGQVNLELSRSFATDDYGIGEPYGGAHGTHVAGIVAANDEDETGVIGSAPGTELVDLRVFDAALDSRGRQGLPPEYWGDTWMGTAMAALVYAAEIGCDAANLSLGWTWNMRMDGWGKFWGSVHQRVGNYVRRQGTIHTHASGNWGESLQFNQDETDSSQMAGGITTSATGPVGFDPETSEYEEPPYSPSTYTTHGVGAIDLAAPGGQGGESHYDNVLNTVAYPVFNEAGEYQGAEYGYDWFAGTSMAAPQVAGAVALAKSANQRYNSNQVRNTLLRTADRLNEYEKKYYGRGGYLDTLAAVLD